MGATWHGLTHIPTQRLIDETSERGEDGVWRYRDARMQRVDNALICAELTRVRASQSVTSV